LANSPFPLPLILTERLAGDLDFFRQAFPLGLFVSPAPYPPPPSCEIIYIYVVYTV
jgi:hypothetical protein